MLENEPIIRRATEYDCDSIILMLKEFVGNDSRFPGSYRAVVLDVISDLNNRVFVAQVGDKNVGFITCSIRKVLRYDRPIVEMDEIYVYPEFRKRGIATKLIEIAENVSKEYDSPYVFFSSNKNRHSAHVFFKELGFVEYGFQFRRSTWASD